MPTIHDSATKTDARTVTAALRAAQEQHELLLQKLGMFPEFASDGAERLEFVGEVRRFLETLRPVCQGLRTTAQYELVDRIADQWQTALSETLREPINVRDLIGLSLPSADLKPSRRLSLAEIERTLRRRADDIAEYRKLSQLFAQIDWLYQLTRAPEKLHDRLPSSQDEMDRDWAYACQFLAADVLEGRVRVADQMDVDAFEFLTNTWLEDTKRLIAYMRWLSDARQPQAAAAHPSGCRYYFGVCESLHAALQDESRKADRDSFCDIADWIARQYLTAEQSLNMRPNSPAWRLVRAKAQRIWEQAPGGSEVDDWLAAEAYVRGYYEHIIPAVMRQSPESVGSILKAVAPQRAGGKACEIINAFEAAIAIEFLDPALVKQVYQPEASFL